MAATDSPEQTTTTTTRPAEAGRFDRPGAVAPAKGSGRATAALVVGILSIPAVLIPILGVALGVTALILGITARSDIKRTGATGAGKAMTGIVLGSIGIVLALILWIATAAEIASRS